MRLLALFLSALVAASSLPAVAACPAANQYSFNFSSQTTATLAYGSSYTYTATSAALGTQSFTVGFTQNGLSSTAVGGETRPNISSSHNGGGTTNALVVGGVLGGRTTSVTSGTRVMVTTFTFATPIRDLSITVHDIDYLANQFRDWVHVTGANGSNTYNPTLKTPFGQVSGTGPYTNASSSLTLGTNTTAGVTAAVQQSVGLSASDNNSTTGNMTISFAEPVTTVTMRYGNYPFTGTENSTGQQAFAISAISWCPVPGISLTKSSSPWSDPLNGTTNPKAIPGADMIYTLTLSNTNSSPTDTTGTIVSDPLPANVTFYNGDIDDSGPLTGAIEFTPNASGLTLGSGTITYLNAANVSITPATGYDPLVRTIRFSPTSTAGMAVSSSAQFKFRVRIN